MRDTSSPLQSEVQNGEVAILEMYQRGFVSIIVGLVELVEKENAKLVSGLPCQQSFVEGVRNMYAQHPKNPPFVV